MHSTKSLVKNITAFLLLLILCTTGNLYAQNSSIYAGETGAALIDLLQADYYPTSPKSYNSARDAMYSSIDNHGGQVTGVYSGYTITTSSRGDAFEKGINTEHTWPQSNFNEHSPMRGDIHHLFPTRIEVNGARSNYPFAEIPDHQTAKWFYDNTVISSIPSTNIDLYSESTNSAFEPREDFKGNIARAVFYFWTIYQDHSSVSGASNESFFNGMKETLYQWHQMDPVNQAEVERSLAVEAVQGNKNPFIHDTSLVRRAYFYDGVNSGDDGGNDDDDGDNNGGNEGDDDISDNFANEEGFDNFPETGSSYEDGSFAGVNGNTWEYVEARGDQPIDGPAPGLAKDSRASLSTTLSGGIAAFSFDYKQLFSTNVNLEVYINDELVATVTSAGEQNILKNSGEISVDYLDEFTIRFQQTSGGGQVGIDNFKWASKAEVGTVSLISPEDNAQDVSQHPVLTWEGSGTIDEYEIQLSESESFVSPIVDSVLAAPDTSFTLPIDLEPETEYFWRVRAVYEEETSDWSATYSFTMGQAVSTEQKELPVEFSLAQNYPNPFNPVTVIHYQLSESSQVSLKVFDVMGREVATLVDGRKSAGSYEVIWNASEMASGIYYYQLKASNGQILTRQMTLIK